ncbi:MAG: phage integrase SAM-like domain-containing protein, partial [Ignavibacteriae bacterium]|nr:phage integrase SAM-like domain-containing protein [Ignavibacteriota bacterium]
METGASLESLVNRHLSWMEQKHYSQQSLKKVRSNLTLFARWCEQRELLAPQEITPTLLKHYQKFLYLRQDEKGRRLSARYQWDQLSTLKRFFRWSHKEGFLLLDPSPVLERPRLPKR